MTTETEQTETQPVNPALLFDSGAAPAPEAPKTEDASQATAAAPEPVLGQAAPAPSEPGDVEPGYEFQQEPEEENTPPVASRPCPAGPSSRHHRDNPY